MAEATPPEKQTMEHQEIDNISVSAKVSRSIKQGVTGVKDEAKSWSKEIHEECFGCMQTMEVFEVFDFLKDNWRRFVYNPYLPAFHKPGWLLDYALGPFNAELFGYFMLDFWAGITVALTLIPQVKIHWLLLEL